MGIITEQQQWEDEVYLIEKQDKVLGGELGVINVQAKQLANRTKYLKGQLDTINQERTGYAPKVSPEFTGVPTAPTANSGTNNTQIATTAFVKTAIAALVGSAPAALDTLEELARALAGDANLKSTLLAEIGKKANATDFNALHDLFIGIPIPYPLSTVPTGCLAMNGQRFDTRRYPKLSQKYPSGQLPDLRGEFIRGWDNGRGVDEGRQVLSWQRDSLKSHTHNVSLGVYDYEKAYNRLAASDISYHRDSNGWGTNGVDGLAVKMNTDYTKRETGTGLINAFGDKETLPRNIAYHYICLAA